MAQTTHSTTNRIFGAFVAALALQQYSRVCSVDFKHVAGLSVAATGLLLACISCHRRHQVFCKFLICKFLHGASLFGHGPGHVLMYIVAGLFVAATGLLLACITRNVYQGPCVCSVARHNA